MGTKIKDATRIPPIKTTGHAFCFFSNNEAHLQNLPYHIIVEAIRDHTIRKHAAAQLGVSLAAFSSFLNRKKTSFMQIKEQLSNGTPIWHITHNLHVATPLTKNIASATHHKQISSPNHSTLNQPSVNIDIEIEEKELADNQAIAFWKAFDMNDIDGWSDPLMSPSPDPDINNADVDDELKEALSYFLPA